MKINETELDLYRNSCDKDRFTQVRKIKPTRRSLSGAYAFRGETMIPFESSLERDFIIRMESFRDVLDVIPQPAQVPFVSGNGRSYVYTPDFLVYFRLAHHDYERYPKPLLVEIKPRNEIRVHWKDWKPKFLAAHRFALEQGFLFKIYDESRIRDVALQNIRFLMRYKHMKVDSVDVAAIQMTLKRTGASTVDSLLAKHYGGIYREQGITHIWHMLASKQLDCDIFEPLSMFTEVWIPSHV
ncbi:MAG: TnsA endonuclease N-terminal domain-containing protein [Moraxellaceae bacterium]|nr:TnsA endonuclease N-terminal domain-containing protein [Moraxellaceae bacterium]MDZ4386577.1 TnsA endonuclease N-terminal domain-containing protein [Moraxellaceae bacterium]